MTVTRDQAIKQLFAAMQNHEETLIAFENDRLCIITNPMGGSNFNREFVAQNNLEIVPLGVTGGTIVLNKGDVGFGYLSKDENNTWLAETSDKIVHFFKSKGLNARRDKNDILVDDKKVSGNGTFLRNGLHLSAIFFAFENSLELIKSICFKQMKKVPTSLSEYGITQADLIGEVIK